MTVVTNDFVIAGFLIENSQCRIIHTGGTVCRENRSCVGEAAAQALRGLFIDLAFISASSWSMRGLSTPNEDKVMVKKAIVEASRRCILLSDTSKYGKIATYLALPIAALTPSLPTRVARRCAGGHRAGGACVVDGRGRRVRKNRN